MEAIAEIKWMTWPARKFVVDSEAKIKRHLSNAAPSFFAAIVTAMLDIKRIYKKYCALLEAWIIYRARKRVPRLQCRALNNATVGPERKTLYAYCIKCYSSRNTKH